jgi:hypothetical protein
VNVRRSPFGPRAQKNIGVKLNNMEISGDQNNIRLDDGTVVQFYPVRGRIKKTHCARCLLFRYPGANCIDPPCAAWQRSDKQNGVFSIREMPIVKKERI